MFDDKESTHLYNHFSVDILKITNNQLQIVKNKLNKLIDQNVIRYFFILN
jgi:hypothetical protein